MNTFNENLRSSVMESLNELELGQKKLNSAENAALFTLYYSQAATIDAVINQEAAKKEQDIREKIKTAAVNNNNESVNLLKSADQASQYLKQSVTNVAVGASNVQIVANAVVRLAGDMGNIMNIINASDHNSEIQPFATDVNEKISETAYEAGLASQFAMESSILTSKVSGDSVLANAKVANDGVNNLLKVVSSDYDAISVTVQTDNTELAAISAAEKIAEGVYEDIRIVRNANNMALHKTIGQLNLNLQAYPKKGSEDSAFEVKFNLLKSPFLDKKDEKDEKKSISFYPVSDYYLFVVKEKNKSAFSISKAEDIVNRSTDKNNVASLTDNNDKAYILLNKDSNTKPIGDAFDVFYTYAQIPDNVPSDKPYHLLDTDGQPVKTGENYVVFLMATFEQAYKKELNTFDDFLSAPSLPFCLTTHLTTPVIIHDRSSKVVSETTKENIVGGGNSKNDEASGGSEVIFCTRESIEILKKTEFRCIYLPVSDAHTNEMTNHAEFKKLDSDIEKLTESSKEISELTKELKDNELDLNRLQKDHSGAFELFEKYVKANKDIKMLSSMSDKDLEALVNKIYPSPAPKEEKTALLGLLKNVITEIYLTSKLNEIKAKIKAGINADEGSLSLKHKSNIDFVFNQKIAEQVSAGNYTLVNPDWVSDNKEKEKLEGIAKKAANLDKNHLADLKFFKVNVTKITTDNFGNPLIKGKRYIPVILAVSTEDETELAKFTNAWSGYQGYNSFKLT